MSSTASGGTTATATAALPLIIQGGMGIGVSDWRLARAVSRAGHLGVVSGTAIDTVMVRRLQDGDPGGHVQRALAHFPIPGVGEEILHRFFLPGGREPGAPYRLLPMYRQVVSRSRQRVTVAAGFVETWLAREGHDGLVGMNLLTKVQMPNLPTLYGAMLANVSAVIMGAGIPREIPGALDALALHQPATLRFDLENAPRDMVELLRFDPADVWHGHGTPTAPLTRPAFYPVVSAVSLAATLARKSNGRVDGFVVEGHTAGGHNAPPRKELRLDATGQPIYGERDRVDFAGMRELGLPFWIAGGAGSPEGLREALAAGAAGIQVGTLFAFCSDSGLDEEVRTPVLDAVRNGTASVFTDPRASPTGYPFKVVQGVTALEAERERVCDLGYLRVAVRLDDGKVVYRCSAEPVDAYVAKGGDAADTERRRCLCNGLVANIGLGQPREGGTEPPLITSGDDLASVAVLAERGDYSATDVIAWITQAEPAPSVALGSSA